METVVTTDLGHVARDLHLPVDQVQRTVALLDEGNTIPFVTRYRREQTGGFDEEQIRRIHEAVNRQRMLAERKQTILKSIESQGRLTEELANQIKSAESPKRLEDLYLPYKPKKQTLATIARNRGLQPLAGEVIDGHPATADLDLRARDFMNPDQGLNSVADVLLGVGHLIAERFSERADLRGKLRRILHRSGKLVSTRVAPPAEEKAAAEETKSESKPTEAPAEVPKAEEAKPPAAQEETVAEETNPPATETETQSEAPAVPEEAVTESTDEAATPPPDETQTESPEVETTDTPPVAAEEAKPEAETPTEPEPEPAAAEEAKPESQESADSMEAEPATAVAEVPAETSKDAEPQSAAQETKPQPVKTEAAKSQPAPAVAKLTKKEQRKLQKQKQKQRDREKKEKAFKDYYDFKEGVGQIPPHRVLALNRGERAKVLRVRVEADFDAMTREAEELLVPQRHPHEDFLRGAVRDALTRLVFPSLERELRRELTDKAEHHAVEVFARNLRKLLLAPPIHGRRVLAVDPGFRSGCKLAALDEFGNVLGHGIIHLVGRDDRKQQGRSRLIDIIRLHRLSLVAIGNGTACREAEELVADVLTKDLADLDVKYVIVNEAGASVYSTSDVGREELTNYDATLRSAISIGRRLQDPLSELVKINPSNIGVGLYQHDVKAKHLRESLDAVVESCVNYVGVDVNTASPSLLKYVSGLNQLTARRLYEHRQQKGPFKSREQIKEVPGLGEQTFVQAAGFLKIPDGNVPLDSTWIHPESYEAARSVLAQLGCSEDDLAPRRPAPAPTPAKEATAPETPAEPTVTEESVADPASSEQETHSVEEPKPQAADEPATEETQPPVEEPSTAETETPVSAETPAEPPEPDTVATPEALVDTPDPTADAAPPLSEDAPVTQESKSGDVPGGEARPRSAGDAPDDAEPQATPKETSVEQATASAVIAQQIAQADVAQLTQELDLGKLLLQDLLSDLARPGRDPREDLPPPIFRRGIMKLEELEPGMELNGTVLNVVDFGAFVDIGLHDSGLIHISRLADQYVRDPHDVVSVGDIIKVWVVEVDKKRRRVSLTAIEPGTEKPPQQRRGKGRPDESHKRSEGEKGDRPPQGRRPRKPRQGDRQRQGRRTTEYKPKKKPKPVKPITKAMKEGREPMRSFSDLAQFIDIKQSDDDEKSDGDEKKK